ncbi:hypothetical protein INP83_00305 [Mucilaginibacter sp. 21P]|uniref:hypothetical protein n=1 Tax=Mucilaginibacter sp. 21P TaxID=2778902 RepID=UPI001C570FEA|nr:hypothetical protein [Mucilaginibacter sp. 21P]QXV65578.1 hypothetical protein INP83_00305 [Mucilaginibacter sp. 21P]
MSKGYIDEGTCLVCSNMTSGSPNTAVAIDDKLDVIHAKPNKRLLRHVDSKVKKDFVCKKPFSSFLGFAGFLIGFGAGFAALGGAAAMATLMGPVGWALLALAIVAIALIAAFAKAHNMCNSALKGQLWTVFHKQVNFKGKSAIYQDSILNCPQGGVIRAVPDPAMAAEAAKAIAFDSMKNIGLKTLSQTVYGFVAGAFSAKTGGLGTNAAGASTLNFGALASTLGFSGAGYYIGEVTNTHGGAAAGTGAAVTVQPFVDELADGVTWGTIGSRLNAWWAFRPGISQMPIVAFFRGIRPGTVLSRSVYWYRFNPNFVKGLGIGIATYLSDAFIIDPINNSIEDDAKDKATSSSAKSSSGTDVVTSQI